MFYWCPVLKFSENIGQEQELENGLFDGHAYSVLKFEKVDDIYGKEHQLVQGKKIKFQLVVKNKTKFLINCLVRNPWGEFEYSGDWSDKSSHWKGSKFNSQLLITAFSIIYRFF